MMQLKASKSVVGLSGLFLLLTLAGCVTGQYAPSDKEVGVSRQQIEERMGKPTGEWDTPEGRVLEYARGPFGKNTYFALLDNQHRVRHWTQVLTLEQFEKIYPGMSAAEVRRLIGRSFEIASLARDRGEVWSYRFESVFCEWFQIEFTAQGTVRSKGMGIPPECSFDDARD
jgi:hypothetical protein